MTLSEKGNAELKKLVKKLNTAKSYLNFKIPRQQDKYKIKIKEIKDKIRQIEKIEQEKIIKIELEKLEEIRKQIKDMRKQESIKIRVKEGEILASYCNGILPPALWLQNHKFCSLNIYMRENPESFKHIKQNKRQKSIAEQVKIAETIAKNNGGQLPHPLLLRETGYISLNICMKKYPCMFKHLQQKKVQRNLKEWLIIAKRLMEENNGEIPSYKQTVKMGYGGLFSRMKRYPAEFKHIKKRKI